MRLKDFWESGDGSLSGVVCDESHTKIGLKKSHNVRYWRANKHLLFQHSVTHGLEKDPIATLKLPLIEQIVSPYEL